MKQLFVVTLFVVMTFRVIAQEVLQIVPYGCDNGTQTTWLSVVPGNITVKVNLTLNGDGPRVLYCLLDGQDHHKDTVYVSGEVVITYEGVGPGNPGHHIAVTPWTLDSVQTAETVSIGAIFPWILGPTIGLVPVETTDTSFQWTVVQGPFGGMPNSQAGTGGCPEDKLFLIGQFITDDGTVLDSSAVELFESSSSTPVEHQFEVVHTVQPVTGCTVTKLVRMDTGVGPPKYAPRELTLAVSERCETIGLLSTSVNEARTDGIGVFPNPCTESFAIQIDGVIGYQVFDLGGRMLRSGQERTVEMTDLPPGVYLLALETLQGKHTTRVIRE